MTGLKSSEREEEIACYCAVLTIIFTFFAHVFVFVAGEEVVFICNTL